MSGIKRRPDGTFDKGQSGNPKGRSEDFSIERDPKLPAARRDAIFRVADRMISVNIDGKNERISIFEACVLQLGKSGATGTNRIASKDFISMALAASEVDLSRKVLGRRMFDRMNAVDEENETLRKRAGIGGGVVSTPYDQWEDFQDVRVDDGSHEDERPKSDE